MLRNKLEEDIKAALKSNDKSRLNVLRMVKSSIRNCEIDGKRIVDDNEIVLILQKEIKVRRESIPDYSRAGRVEKVDELEKEANILEEYLPRQLTSDEIRDFVCGQAAEIAATSKKDLGKLMKAVMPHLRGNADSSLVSEIVNDVLKD